MSSSPGLFSSLRHREALRQSIQRLKSIFYLHKAAQSFSHLLLKFLLHLRLDDKNDRLKACPLCIIDRIIQNLFSIFSHRVNLLQAVVPAAHAGCQHHQYRFVHPVHASQRLIKKSLFYSIPLLFAFCPSFFTDLGNKKISSYSKEDIFIVVYFDFND